MSNSDFKYLPHIDGLRAVAIIFVILFHFFPQNPLFHGGYIGVDIFFVISGYLITKIIKTKIDTGTFSYWEFYKARINRIFPSLVLVLFLSTVFAWFLLYAEDLKRFGHYLVSASLFTSNFLLNHEVGYFDVSNYHKPFLHLWSLGVEEQFYFIWPLLFVFIYKRNLTTLILFAIVASFLLQYFEAINHSTSAFYLPWFRFWELFVGAFLALNESRLFSISKINHHYLSIAGAFLVFFSIYICGYGSNNNFYTLVFPIIGSSLLIASGSSSLINERFLSLEAVRYIGLISYPLYLWHWVIIYFDQTIFGGRSEINNFFLLLLSICLSVITYHFYEKPIRASRSKHKYIVLLLILSIIGFAGYRMHKRDGYPHRQGVHKEAFLGIIGNDEFIRSLIKTYMVCTPKTISESTEKYLGHPVCFQSKSSEVKNIAIVGDSHAGQLFPGLAEKLANSNIVYYNEGFLTGLDKQKKLLDLLINDKNISTVIFAYYWSKQLSKVDSKTQADFTNSLISILRSGKKVVLMQDIPNFSFDASECKYFKIGHRVKCQERGFYNDLRRQYQDNLNAIISKSNVRSINLDKYFCDKNLSVCKMINNNQILYRDDNHLNIDGSVFLAGKLVIEHPDVFLTSDQYK